MRLGLRAKLVLGSLGVILASMFAADAYLAPSVERLLADRIRDDLTVRAELAAEEVAAFPAGLDDLAAWDAHADRLGRLAHARVTLVRLDGRVLGDSTLPGRALADVGNHRDRPEIREALAGRTGGASRFSETLGERMTYVAVPFRRGAGTAGVVRLALALTEVDTALALVRRIILVASLIALGVALVLSSGAAEWASRTARQLSEAAKRMAAGDLSTRTRVRGWDEFAELGRSLDQLAASLSSTVSELRRERDLLGGILAGMHEGVLLLDREGMVALVNPALREMLLLNADAIGRPPLEVVRHPELNGILEKARASRTTATGELELSGLKPRRLLVRALALSGEPAGVLAVFVDVTDLRRLESLRRDFVANVSHELRTPVTAIRSATETLHEAARNDPRSVPMFIDIVDRNAERLHLLIEDLLDLSRIESRMYRLDLERTELGAVVGQVLALFRERAVKKHVRLVSAVSADAPHAIADRRALEQVLSNLLENAIKYCRADAEIRVRVAEDGGSVRVQVEDTGPGIEARHLPRLFERFYRVDAGRSREIGGTGLGLSIVKHLVEAMGGTVWVESELGQGSTFLFTLPKAAAAAGPVALTGGA